MMMRTSILILAMAIFSGSAWSAEWILIKDDAKSGEKTYIDKNTLGRAETLAIMWSLINHQKPKGVAGRAHLSEKSLIQYDCKNHQSRRLEFQWYSSHDAEGESIYSQKEPESMLTVKPGSGREVAWKIACETS
jgi:hypothetical protein